MADQETGRLAVPMNSTRATDAVMSPDGSKLYVSGADGTLKAYDVATRSLVASWTVGPALGAVDISPDGSFLMVSEYQAPDPVGGQTIVTLYKIATATGAVTAYPYSSPTWFSIHDVAILDDLTVLMTLRQSFRLLSFDTGTGSFSYASGFDYGYTSGTIVTSRDRSEALIARGDSGDAPLAIYESGTAVTDRHGNYADNVSGYNRGVQAFSRESNLVVQHIYNGGVNVYDANLVYKFNLDSAYPKFTYNGTVGMQFDASGANLFLLDDTTDTIIQLSTADWSVVRTFAVGANVGEADLGFFGNRLLLSPDGRYFTVLTSTGVRLVENDGLANSFTGTSAADDLQGGAGNDVLDGAGGNDSLKGGTGNDQLNGGDGDDLLAASLGLDGADGGTGADTLVLEWGDTVRPVSASGFTLGANGYSGTYYEANFFGPVERSVAFSAIERFVITTGSGSDFLTTGTGDDVVSSGGANDSVDVGTGNDTADGGAGDDRLSADLSAATAAIVYNLVTGSYSGPVGSFSNFEGLGLLRTGSGNDEIVTTSAQLDDTIFLGSGNDRATVRKGTDTVHGGDGTDTLVIDYSAVTGSVVTSIWQGYSWGTLETGYNGMIDSGGGPRINYSGIEHFDITATSAAIVNIETGRGNDRIVTGNSGSRIAPGGGDDYVDAGGGSGDEIDYSQRWIDREAGTVGVIVNLSAQAYVVQAGHPLAGATVGSYEAIDNWGGRDTILGIENAQSGDQNDVLLGNALGNVFYAWGGNDLIVPDAGFDYINAGDGVDLVDYSAETGANGVVVNLEGSGIFVSAAGWPMSLSPGQALDSFGHLDSLVQVEQIATGGLADRVYGNASDNLFSLGGGADDAFGFAGNDLLVGGAGDDELYGGLGDDRLEGGSDNDILLGDAGNDTIDSGAGDDIAYGGTGNDVIGGGEGTDVLRGEDGNDILSGEGGNDLIRGGAGVDSFDGGGNDGVFNDITGYGDRVSFVEQRATQGVVADLRTGTISNDGFGNVETMTGFESLGADTAYADTLYGNDSVNFLFAGLGDGLYGFGGDDCLQITAAAATVDGGDGVDTLRVLSNSPGLRPDTNGDGNAEIMPAMTAGYVVNLAAGTLRDGYNNVGAVTGIENVIGSLLADDLRGSSGDNLLDGGEGNDFLRLHDGGADTAIGGLGNDVFLFGGTFAASDQVDGGAGTDQIALQGDYSAGLTLGSNVVSVENFAILPGNDTRFGDPGTNFYDYQITTQDVAIAVGVMLVVDANRLRAGEDFTFDGSAETDGSFFIYGGGGVDTLTGGARNDVFIFGGQNQWGASDVVTGGAGIDQLALRGNYTIVFGAGQLIGIEQIGMVSAQDTRYGALGSSYSYDLTMNDANVDGIQMTVDAAPLRPGETLTFDGSAEDDGSFRVFGGRGNDTIAGSQNGDIIAGRLGRDAMTGNGGADTFRFDLAEESAPGAADHILDFTPGTDRIDLSRIDANTQAEGNQAFTWIGSNAFGANGATSAGQLRIYESNGSWFAEGDTDGNGAADFVLQLTLVGPTALAQGDFLL